MNGENASMLPLRNAATIGMDNTAFKNLIDHGPAVDVLSSPPMNEVQLP